MKELDKIYFGSKTPIFSVEGKYYYLYKTTNMINNKIYIGARSTKTNPYKDKYVGCGIMAGKYGGISGARNKHCDFYQAVLKHGVSSFKKEILLFFSSLQDVLLAERIVVDEKFVSLSSNYNKAIGGGLPPTRYGRENGNYGNFWTEDQKKSLSEKKKKMDVYKKENNPKAKECFLYDFLTDTKYDLKYIREIPQKIGKKLDYNWNSIMSYRYILCDIGENPYERAKSLKKSKFVILVIEKFKEGKTVDECVDDLNAYGSEATILKRTYKKLIDESNKH